MIAIQKRRQNMINLNKYGVNQEKGRGYENIIYMLALVYSHYEKVISEYLADYKMTVGKFNILMVVRFIGKEEGISQVAIGERLIVSAGNITTLVEKLVKEGLVSRVQNPDNRRENIIRITKKGESLTEKIWPGYNDRIEKMTNLLPKKEHEYFSKNLGEWYSKLVKGK